MPSFFIKTYGCQMNEHDSLQMARLLERDGYCTAADVESADLIILNTCSVREKAVQKIRSEIGRLKMLRQIKPHLIIGVAGCVAEHGKEDLKKTFPGVDFILGPDHVDRIAEIVRQCRQDGHNGRAGRTWTGIAELDHANFLSATPASTEHSVKAHIVIQKGCDNYCSYCIVPYVRGSEVSRPPQEILDEITMLVGCGVKEVTLLGQNVNSYGAKTSLGTSFAELLEKIATQTGLKRLRFATSHPKDVSDALIEQFATNPILMPHFHLPAQCGSDRILAMMNRGYTHKDYLNIIDRVRAKANHVRFSSDFIVGFPTESAEDFEQTLALMRSVRFDLTFSFVYSPRPFTRAQDLTDDVSPQLKRERLQVLQSLDQQITLEQNQKEVGSMQDVLIERTDNVNPELPNMGRTPGNKQIFLDGTVSVGDIVSAKVVEGKGHYLIGSVL